MLLALLIHESRAELVSIAVTQRWRSELQSVREIIRHTAPRSHFLALAETRRRVDKGRTECALPRDDLAERGFGDFPRTFNPVACVRTHRQYVARQATPASRDRVRQQRGRAGQEFRAWIQRRGTYAGCLFRMSIERARNSHLVPAHFSCSGVAAKLGAVSTVTFFSP